MRKIVSKGRFSKYETRKPRFWTFGQNNSGGSFDINHAAGISHYVIVEAYSDDEANSIAKGIGLYFDGYGDCSCCGDRWCEAYGSGDETPSLYGTPLPEAGDNIRIDYKEGDAYVYVHFLNGTIEGWA